MLSYGVGGVGVPLCATIASISHCDYRQQPIDASFICVEEFSIYAAVSVEQPGAASSCSWL